MTLYTDMHHVPFVVDSSDVEAVSRYCWCIDGVGYPSTAIGRRRSRRCGPERIRLHEFLGGKAPKALYWDHINRNKLDNRRSNLRLVTPTGNVRNQGPSRASTTGVRGVHQAPGVSPRWEVRIKVRGIENYIGCFSTLESAVAARRLAEERLWV